MALLALLTCALRYLAHAPRHANAAAPDLAVKASTKGALAAELRDPDLASISVEPVALPAADGRNVVEQRPTSTAGADPARGTIEVRFVGDLPVEEIARPRARVSLRGRPASKSWKSTDELGRVLFEVESGVPVVLYAEWARGAGDTRESPLDPLAHGEHRVESFESRPWSA